MRRILLIVAMMLIAAAPAMATVTVNAKHIGLPVKTGVNCTTVEVNYVCVNEKVRAFALEVSVSNGYTITAIRDFNIGESNKISTYVPIAKPGYGIFPGKFRDVINPADPCWPDGNYNPIAPAADADANGTGLGTNKIIVELGSLYVGDNNAPPASGRLFNLDIQGPPNSTTTITLAKNVTRGGVVREDGNSVADANLTLNGHTGAGFPDRFPCWAPYNTQYAQFIDPNIGKPDCWTGQYAADANWKYQCYGDADGKVEGAVTKYRVYTSDYNKLFANWRKKATQLRGTVLGSPAICTDFDHMVEGAVTKYRVYTSDYNRLFANWRKKDTQLKGAPCPGPNASASY